MMSCMFQLILDHQEHFSSSLCESVRLGGCGVYFVPLHECGFIQRDFYISTTSILM